MPSDATLTQTHAKVGAERTQPPTRLLSRAGLASIALMFVAGNSMILGYIATQTQVQLLINDRPFTLRTHQQTVGALFEELHLPLTSEDIVLSSLDSPLTQGGEIVIRKALPVTLRADRLELQLRTHAYTVADFVREAGITLDSHDRVLVEGEEVQPDSPLKASTLYAASDENPSTLWLQPPLQMEILRAVPITVHDGAVSITIMSTAPTVGQALFEEGMTIYLGDGVTPSLGTQSSAGMQVYIQRSKPLVILADDRRIKTRTQGDTVAQALTQESIELEGRDYTIPEQATEVYDNMTVQVIRVQEQVVLEEEPIPFETVWQADAELELDNQRVDQWGAAGAKRRLVRIVYENGAETERVTEDEWVEAEPTTETISYGTKIVLRQLQTPDGEFTYWRHFRAYATAYTATHSGTPRDAPWWGRTYTGLPARKGVIAVDPNVIPMGTWMYVPGYGKGLAADRGVYGKHIDLCYDDDKWPPPWHWFVDVYLLTPVPAAERIHWILPSYPRES
jgi:uncharacterized protein YabE (DUF348 family)